MSTATILIADDDTALLQAMECRLESLGFEVFTTQDGYQALAIARREHPDLLILDIAMPAGSGVSVLQRIRAIDEIADVPVIFITGHDMCRVERETGGLTNAVVIQKPFDTGTLIATIHEALEGNPIASG
ncbi:MAG: response regulator [Phycisphaerales bacterium]|nr:response regulator [Phycisphaerales bacterium]